MKSKFLGLFFLTLCMSCVPETETDFTTYVPDTEETFSDTPDIGAPTPAAPKPIPPKVVEDAVKACEEATNDGSLITYQTTVFFPAAIECEFNEGGMNLNQINSAMNGPRIDAKITARVEQSYKVNLPTAGKVCDLEFDFPKQTMKYDDEIFLLLENYVLMSSTNYATNSGSSHYATKGLKVNELGLQEYNWMGGSNALYGLHYGGNITPKYCLGQNPSDADYNEKCQIPQTDVQGQIKLDIPSEELIKLGLASNNLSEASEMNFGFVSTGDNDNGDCEHSAVSFGITVKYIP